MQSRRQRWLSRQRPTIWPVTVGRRANDRRHKVVYLTELDEADRAEALRNTGVLLTFNTPKN